MPGLISEARTQASVFVATAVKTVRSRSFVVAGPVSAAVVSTNLTVSPTVIYHAAT